MTKKELVKVVAGKTEFTQKDVGAVVDAMLETITETMIKGEDVAFSGFGTFKTSVRAARIGRNPSTGEELQIPETKVVKFTPFKDLKEAVKNS